jgi:predicted methyltransferase
MRKGSALVCCALLACASGTKNERPAGIDRGAAEAIVAAPDRSDRDRGNDSHRKPVDMLAFFGPAPGMRIAELGAGGGYSTALFARAVGPSGKVYAQDTPNWDGPGLQRAWQMRLASPSMQNTQHFLRQWDDPLPPEAQNLDAVYSVAVYHDAIAEKSSTAQMNAAVFRALKPGGVYAIIDNSAKDGDGAADAESLHRVDEALVKKEVEAAGFRLVETAAFLRNPNDTRDWNADPTNGGVPGKVHTQDRFALKFVKP